MEQTIEELIKGNGEIANFYRLARERGDGILGNAGRPIDVTKLADRLRDEQLWFEKNCGGRHIGQEVMAVVGIAHLTSEPDGFGENAPTALAVANAFEASMCSVEVKSMAMRVAALYDVIEP